MYAKSKAGSVPSDSQAREKLAMYVYEYLMHVGANSAAQVFLKEIGWEKTISLGESPGFLHSWWCVFWDLYCASPEKRDTCEHSPEAKAFHDYSAATAPSPMNPVPSDGMCQMPPGYFQPAFIGGPRYPHGGPRPGMQGHGPQPMLSGMEASRQSHMMRMIHNRNMHGGASGWSGNPEQYQQSYGGMHRMPASAGGSIHPHGNIPMSMHPRSQWPGNPSAGGPGGPAGPGQTAGGPPGTPIMRSPPGTRAPALMHPPPPQSQQQQQIHQQQQQQQQQRNSRFNDLESRKTPSNDTMSSEYGGMVKQMPPHQQMASSFAMTNIPENSSSTCASTSMPSVVTSNNANPSGGPSGPVSGGGGGGPVSQPSAQSNQQQQQPNGINGNNPDGNLLEGLPKTSPQNAAMPSMGNMNVGPNMQQQQQQANPHTPQDNEDNSFDIMSSFPENEQTDFMKMQQCMGGDASKTAGDQSDFANFMQ